MRDVSYPNLLKDPIGKEFLKKCGEINARYYTQRFWNPKLDPRLRENELDAFVKSYTKAYKGFFATVPEFEVAKAKELNNFSLPTKTEYKLA